jgi:hypothetical protein
MYNYFNILLTTLKVKNFSYVYFLLWGHTVVQLVETLRYRPEGRSLDSRRCNWNFSLK